MTEPLHPEIQARVDAVRAARGSRQIQHRPRAQPPACLTPEWFTLTPRRLQILELVADGLWNKEIAAKLWVTEETIKTTVRLINRQLGARNRQHAVKLGYELGLLRPTETDGTITP